VERENSLSENGGQPGDHFYHGVINKIFWSNETGVIRSDSGKDVPFVFEFVTLLGAPRQDINFLRPGMRVGFDVGWTSKGLRASVIKIYDLFAETVAPEQIGTTTDSPVSGHREEGRDYSRQEHYLGAYGVPEPAQYRQRRPRSNARPQKRNSQQPQTEENASGSLPPKKD